MSVLYPQHEPAKSWLDEQLNGQTPVGLPWPSLLAFLRLTTNRRIFEQPESMFQAWRQVAAWLDCTTVWIPESTEQHRELLAALLNAPDIHGNLVPDAHLAVLAIEHDLLLCSTDSDFGRFPGLRWHNPLSATA
jgi:toxin-antitoxin system PIN domain toxin